MDYQRDSALTQYENKEWLELNKRWNERKEELLRKVKVKGRDDDVRKKKIYTWETEWRDWESHCIDSESTIKTLVTKYILLEKSKDEIEWLFKGNSESEKNKLYKIYSDMLVVNGDKWHSLHESNKALVKNIIKLRSGHSQP